MKRVAIAFAVGFALCVVLVFGLIRSGVWGPRITRTIWQYDHFEFVGDSEEADLLLIGPERPTGLVIEGREGRKIPVSSIDWQTATTLATSKEYHVDLESGGQEVEMVRMPGNHFRHFFATFVKERFVSAQAGDVRVFNTVNEQHIKMPAIWADVERCFGKPLKKSRQSHSAPWR